MMRDEPRPSESLPAAGAPVRRVRGVAAFPLLLAYALLPLAGVLSRFGVAASLPAWFVPHWPWAALACAGVLAALLSSGRARRVSLPVLLLCAAVGAGLTAFALRTAQPLLQGPFFPVEKLLLLAVPEAAPLAFVLFSCVWVWTFGAPERIWFRRLGALLGAAVLADVLLSSMAAGFLLPGGMVLPRTGTEARACLLALALLVEVDDESALGRYPGWPVMLLMGGLLASGSAAALLAAGSAYLFLGRVRIEARIGFALACAGGVGAPLFGGLPLDMDGRMQVYMTWMAGLESFAREPLALLKGFGPWPLDLRLPEEAAKMLGMPDMHFTLPPRAVPAFWLRLALVWGALPALAALLTCLGLTAVTPGRAMAAVMALGLAQGAVFPLLYDGGVAVPFCLAVACLLAEGARVLRAAQDAKTDAPENAAPTHNAGADRPA